MIKHIKLSIILLLSTTWVSAQSITGSPFSSYGYGIIENTATGSSPGMGGSSTGLRLPNEINTINPAAYSAIPRQTFLFNAGLRSKRVEYSDGLNKSIKYDNGFTGLNAAFSINDYIAAGFGLAPYSSIGYKISAQDSIIQDDIRYDSRTNYYGEGGLNKLYFTTAFKYKGFSLGADFSYIFGQLSSRIESGIMEEPYAAFLLYDNDLRVRTLYIKYGLQYMYELSDKKNITIGATYNNKTSFDTRQTLFAKTAVSNNYNSYGDTILQDTVFNMKSELPQAVSAGLSYRSEKWLFTADYSAKFWEGIQIAERSSSSLTDSYRVSGGFEFSPSPTPENYFQAIRYRLGGYYANNYLRINGNPVQAYALTIGLGLPAQKSRTMINLAFEIGQRGDIQKNLLKENYYGLNISLNMADIWFIKRKFD